MMKRNILILIILAALILPVATLAAKLETATIDGLNYSFFDDVATVEASTYRKSVLTIPPAVSYNGRVYIVEAIAPNAFKSNTYITKVELPSTLLTIGTSAFQGCRVASINLPFGLTDIGSYAFASTYLTYVTIPTTAVGLGSHIFYNCQRLTGASVLSNIGTLPSYMFYNCVNLTTVTLPSMLTGIGDHCFMRCNNLRAVPSTSSMTTIGASAFEHCPLIDEVELTLNIEKIGSRAFADNAQITSIVVRPMTPPTLASDAFDKEVMRNALTVVPTGTKSLYKRASVWASFGKLREVDEVIIRGDVNDDGSIDSSDVSILMEIILAGTGGEINLAADVNNNGTIDSTDLAALLEIVLEQQ